MKAKTKSQRRRAAYSRGYSAGRRNVPFHWLKRVNDAVIAGWASGQLRWARNARRDRVASCCWIELRKVGNRGSGYIKDGEEWQCPRCRTRYQYVEDEAEGGAWHPLPPNATSSATEGRK